MHVCRICGNDENNAEYLVREMLFGTWEQFRYLKCGNCGCLQIVDIPRDMSKYYPPNYSAFDHTWKQKHRLSFVRQKLKNRWKRAYIDRHVWINRLLIGFLGKPALPEWMIRTGINTNSPILDIGCGDGNRLLQMSEIGFKDLTGIDRYMKFEHEQQTAIKFFNQDLYDLDGTKKKYDVIMLHHSLEHMSEQFETLSQIGNLLSNHGSVVIRIPIVSSFGWRQYGTNWFALDAPRHFYLHTENSMQLVAEKTGFTITSLYYDSTPQILWASEQYTKNIPFMDERSLRFGLDKSIFTKQDIEAFRLKAQKLNESQDGDTACFILKRK